MTEARRPDLQLHALLLCDYAMTAQDGKISAIGIFSQITVSRLPAVHGRLFVVAIMEAAAGRHELAMQVISPSGESLLATIDLTCSSMICVCGGSVSSLACCSSVPQPSSNASPDRTLNRCSIAHEVPRPLIGFGPGGAPLAGGSAPAWSQTFLPERPPRRRVR